MNNLLKKILDQTRLDNEKKFADFNPDNFILNQRKPPLPFKPGPGADFKFIAEIKRFSPLKGGLRPALDPAVLAGEYQAAGAGAVSVITEKHFFRGDVQDLVKARNTTSLPLLRKDFMVHPGQVYESFNLGADLILLIAACLEDQVMAELAAAARRLGLAVLFEIHGAEEIERVLPLEPSLIAVNNRNLLDFSVDPNHSLAVKPLLPTGIPVISASGLNKAAQIAELRRAGFAGVLVGEHLVRSSSPPAALAALING